MARKELKPRAVLWKAQKNTLSYGGPPPQKKYIFVIIIFFLCIKSSHPFIWNKIKITVDKKDREQKKSHWLWKTRKQRQGNQKLLKVFIN